jgi:hypothetical protein
MPIDDILGLENLKRDLLEFQGTRRQLAIDIQSRLPPLFKGIDSGGGGQGDSNGSGAQPPYKRRSIVCSLWSSRILECQCHVDRRR